MLQHQQGGGLILRNIPKVELHLHIEGAIGAGDARHLIARHGRPEAFPGVETLFRHDSFGQFLEHFGALTRLFRSGEDLVWILHRHLARLKRQGVVYAEIRVSPTIWERRGLDPEATLAAVCAQVGRAPIEFRLIVDAVRHWDTASIARDLDLCLQFRKRGVVALGLGGDETAAPAAAFRDLAGACRSAGIPVIPHAGEALPSAEVLSALEVFRPTRIGHGIHAADDPEAARALRETGTHLELCPTSNRRTGAYASGLPAAFRRLVDGAVPLSVNTDDPGLFSARLTSELRWAARTARRGIPWLALLQAGAGRASLLPPPEKASLLAALGAP